MIYATSRESIHACTYFTGSTAPQLTEEARCDLYQVITNDVKTMKRKFSRLLERIWNSIDDLKGTVAYLVDMAILSEEDEKQVKEALSINDVRILLAQKYWSFLDYENLENIVETKCGDNEQKLMKAYCEEVKKFCERRVTEFPPGSLSNSTDHPGMKKLIVTLDLNDPSLKHIKHLKVVIANILGCPASKLVLYDIEDGSVVVTFLVVASVGAKLFLTRLLTSKQEDVLREEHVISLKYESTVVFSTDKEMETQQSEVHHTQNLKGISTRLKIIYIDM